MTLVNLRIFLDIASDGNNTRLLCKRSIVLFPSLTMSKKIEWLVSFTTQGNKSLNTRTPQPWAPSALTHTPFGLMPGRAAAKTMPFKRRNLVPILNFFMAMQKGWQCSIWTHLWITFQPFEPPMNKHYFFLLPCPELSQKELGVSAKATPLNSCNTFAKCISLRKSKKIPSFILG
jgi:hypothetical protein